MCLCVFMFASRNALFWGNFHARKYSLILEVHKHQFFLVFARFEKWSTIATLKLYSQSISYE